MVRTLSHCLDSKPLAAKTIDLRFSNNAGVVQKTHPSVQIIPNYSSRKQNKTQRIVLKPLDFSQTFIKRNQCPRESKNVPEFRAPDKPNICGIDTTKNAKKTLPSKIPVFKGRTKLLPLTVKNTCNVALDSTLSAADKRQKFHQSRLLVTPGDVPAPSFPANEQCKSCLEASIVKTQRIQKKQDATCNADSLSSSTVLQKDSLPGMKTYVPVGVTETSTIPQVKKKKGLLGEFTHFPAMCNNLHSRPVRKSNRSTVPHLPPIFPPPAAPPPSISASVEQEAVFKEGGKCIEAISVPNVQSSVLHFLIPI